MSVDIGCGAAGAWAIEVAKEYPAASVCGLDLSPVDGNDVPENCHFVIGDVNKGLPFGNGSMDLVQSRLTILEECIHIEF
jgi:ubiquinone/menaquinone biosynthesis C-methylase UbiE